MADPDNEPMAYLPSDVRAQLAAYRAELDRAQPGRLEGLYVVGSLALGDFRARGSNIDVVAVSAEPWTAGALADARRAQKLLDRDRPAAAVYATWDQLGTDPRPLPDELANPLTWRILRDDAMVEVGPDYPRVWSDDRALVDWARAQLHQRWAPWAARARRRPLSNVLRATVSEQVLRAAQVFGAAGGRVQSKSAAARAAIGTFGPNQDRMLRDALGHRDGSRTSMYWGPLERRRHAIELIGDLAARAAALNP